MAYVAGCKHDIFVSYAHVDNEPVPGSQEGWVSTLVETIRNQLARVLGRKDSFSLWMDPQLPGNRHLTPEILDNLRSSATLLVVLSPAYLASEWCLRELNAFLAAVAGTGSHSSRIFLVEPHCLDLKRRPPELADLLGYCFWEEDGGVQRTLSVVAPRHNEDGYYAGVGRLVQDLTRELKLLGAAANDASPPVVSAVVAQVPTPASSGAVSILPVEDQPTAPEEVHDEPRRVEALPDSLRRPQQSSGLFVGVGEFDPRSYLSPLRYAVDDAIALAHLFTLEVGLVTPSRARLALGGLPTSNGGRKRLDALKQAGVKVVPATKTELLYALDELNNPADGTEGMILLSVSTHGYEEKGVVYLMPTDGSRRFVAATGLSSETLAGALGAISASTKILMIDACRGTVEGSSRGDEVMSDRFRQALTVPQGATLIASCGVGQLSWESPRFEQGVFTHFLLDGLRGGAPVRPDDGLIRLEDVLAYALQGTNEWVKRHIRVEQLPWFGGDKEIRQLPLAVSIEARRRAEAVRERQQQIERRRQNGLRCLIEARLVPENRAHISAALQDSIERALERLTDEKLDELLDMLDRLADRKPVSCRAFVAWWNAERALSGPPTVATGDSARASSVSAARSERRPVFDTPWTNSLGMKFVPINGILFAVWQTRLQDFKVFVEYTSHDAESGLFSWDPAEQKWRPQGLTWRNHNFPQSATHPVAGVSWEDADAFCRWLTEKERLEHYLSADHRYRLPTDAEWSAAVGQIQYPWGDEWPPPATAGNYGLPGAEPRADKSTAPVFGTTPVGSFPPNARALFDLGGNVWEWCDDWYRKELNPVQLRAEYKYLDSDEGGNAFHFMRGASWFNKEPTQLLSAFRNRGNVPNIRFANVGFRCVLDSGSISQFGKTGQEP